MSLAEGQRFYTPEPVSAKRPLPPRRAEPPPLTVFETAVRVAKYHTEKRIAVGSQIPVADSDLAFAAANLALQRHFGESVDFSHLKPGDPLLAQRDIVAANIINKTPQRLGMIADFISEQIANG